MWGLVARLSRSIPLALALVVLAVLLYVVVTWLHSPAKAKEVLIRVFTVICAAITAFFGLFTLYAAFEHNSGVFELAVSCAAVGVIGLVVVLICKRNFLKHNPSYKWRKLFAKHSRAAGASAAPDSDTQATIIDDAPKGGEGSSATPDLIQKANILGQIARLLLQLFRK